VPIRAVKCFPVHRYPRTVDHRFGLRGYRVWCSGE
jgi:hypothetical protein